MLTNKSNLKYYIRVKYNISCGLYIQKQSDEGVIGDSVIERIYIGETSLYTRSNQHLQDLKSAQKINANVQVSADTPESEDECKSWIWEHLRESHSNITNLDKGEIIFNVLASYKADWRIHPDKISIGKWNPQERQPSHKYSLSKQEKFILLTQREME